MKSEIITIDSPAKYEVEAERIASFLKNGKIVIMPSDTIYGFLTLPENEEKLRIIKKRENKPFLFLIYDIFQLDVLNISLDPVKGILSRYWPGAVTFIMRSRDEKTVGIRFPDWRIMQHIIKLAGSPLLSTSVNYSGEPALSDTDEIIKEFEDKVDLIVVDKSFKGKNSSTIADISSMPYRIIRKGEVDVSF
jgi:L-threonylcarbamoyladenylate synthase